MAVGIMAARVAASPLSLFLLSCFLQVLIQGQMFRAPPSHEVFLRSKRANQYLLEEILQGNLERECFEENCNYEEAREYFENDKQTIAFWTVYKDGDQCKPNPCLHGGNCTDRVGGFNCSCPETHHGAACELRMLECPTEGPVACHQVCTASRYSYYCSCLPGFKLEADERTCVPEVEFPCGQLPAKYNTTASICPHGNCPWQVSLITAPGEELCSGVVLGPRSVLTAASCLFLVPERGSTPRPSDFFVLPVNRKMVVAVRALYVHHRYRRGHHDNDLVLLELAVPLPFGHALIHLCLPTRDFCENILMQSGRPGHAGTRGVSQLEELAYMSLDECRSQLSISHVLSNKMFCMKTPREPTGTPRSPNAHIREPDGGLSSTHDPQDGAGNSSARFLLPGDEGWLRSGVSSRRCDGPLTGTPVVTEDRGTVYVTGLLMSSSAGCDGGSVGGLVFTKLSRYLNWIKPRLEDAESRMTPQISLFPWLQ
ncbi:protein Z, vitamin K-dependent plasma glycoprotein b [Notolabrus celidotus]|uniref:protein Z, vitamin K-dependent plasma glycoprotein b n=1 Tax=Notolabrus celidotus TaxID=1203425 RepID=UPI00148FA502|nr:protein Z, vitamin K-dependent plasma glycoprotein b [Notolabrus celidotus]